MWTFTLCDRDSDADLADLTPWSTSKSVSVRLSRPSKIELTVPGDSGPLQGNAGDGLPMLWPGVRTIKAYQDGTLRQHVVVWNWAPSGDENNTSWTLTGYDPMIYLQKRYVQDNTGNFSNPSFPSPISGAEIVQTSIENTIANDGPLPIDTTGPLASSTDLGADLTNWPVKIGDLITTLTETGALDLYMFPVDTHTGFAAGIVGQLWGADALGSDLSGSVNFDYGTGDHSISNIRRSFDMDELCNKLWFYLGQRQDDTHYPANITGTETGPTGPAPYAEDLSAFQTLQLASRALYLVMMDVQQFDIAATKDSPDWATAMKLWHQLWKQSVLLHVNPRELLYVTPAPGTGSVYRPFVDYMLGDVVSVNASSIVGPAISGADQRIYGFDIGIDANGVERVSELIVSADGL